MTSEIRTNSLKSRAGLSTVTLTDSGPMFSGITTFVDNSGFNIGTGSSIFSPAANTLTFGTNSNERFRIDPDGHITVGVAASALYNTYLTIPRYNVDGDAAKFISLRNDTAPADVTFVKSRSTTYGSYAAVQDDDFIMAINSYIDTGSALSYRGTYRSIYDSATNGVHFMWGSGTAASTSGEKMRLTATGNLGIGSAIPSTKLDVIGTVKADNISVADSILHTGDTDTKIVFTDNQIDLQTGGFSRAYVNNYALYIRSGFPLGFLASSGPSSSIKSGGTNNQDLLFTAGTGNPTRMQITSSGNVGIGSDIPAAKLDVVGSLRADGSVRIDNNASPTFYLTSTSTTGSGRIFFGDPDSDLVGRLSYVHNGDYFTFYAAYGERFRIAGNGDITVTSIDANATGPTLKLFHNSGSPAVNDVVSRISMFGDDSAGNETEYGRIETKVDNVTDGQETAHINFATRGLGSYANVFRIKRRSTASAPSYTTDDADGMILDVYNTGNPYPRYMNFIAKSAGNTDSNIGFWTEAVGGSPTEKLRITSSGTVNIGGNYTQTTFKAQIQTGTNKFISFTNAAHNDLSNEGSGIIFSRQNDGSKELSGIFGHSNSSLGIAARTDLTFHAGGSSTYSAAPERLRITSGGQIRIPTDGQQLTWGASQQMKFYYESSEERMYLQGDGAYGFAIRVNNGNRIEIQKTTGDVIMQGSGGKNFQWDNSEASLYLTDSGSGASSKLKIGTGADLQLYHDVGGANHIVCANNQELKLSANLFSFYDYTGVTQRVRITSDGYMHLGNSGHGTNKVGGQAITGQDFDPIFKIYNSTASKWLMHLRNDNSTAPNGIFMRAGNASTNYTLYLTGGDENNPHLIARGDGAVLIGESTQAGMQRGDVVVHASVQSGNVSEPAIIHRDSNGDIIYFEHYFYCVKGGAGNSHTVNQNIIRVTSLPNFHQAGFHAQFAVRLQGQQDNYTRPASWQVGVNRFNGNNSIQTQEFWIEADSSVQQYANLEFSQISGTATDGYNIRMNWTPGTYGSSFAGGKIMGTFMGSLPSNSEVTFAYGRT